MRFYAALYSLKLMGSATTVMIDKSLSSNRLLSSYWGRSCMAFLATCHFAHSDVQVFCLVRLQVGIPKQVSTPGQPRQPFSVFYGHLDG